MAKKILAVKGHEMGKKINFFLFFLSIFLSACASPPGGDLAGGATTPTSTSNSGNILVANNAARTVVMFDQNMNYVKHVIQLAAGNVPASLAVFDADEILVAIEGAPDRVIRVNLTDGSFTTPVLDSTNFTGTVKGLARLASGDILSSDATTGAHLEKYTANGVRITSGFPFTLLNTLVQIYPLSSGNFVACAGGTSDSVRVYNPIGTVVTAAASATSPIPTLGAAHDGNGCVADSNGRVAVAWNGATDAIRLYNSTLTTTVWSFTNPALTNPGPLAVRPNNNILAADSTTGVIYEASSAAGAYVTEYSSAYVDVPNAILVMP